MIDPKELRIGNLINTISGIGEVLLITNSGITAKFKEFRAWIPEKNMNPIPITEEILMKLGFERYPYNSDLFTIGGFFAVERYVELYEYCPNHYIPYADEMGLHPLAHDQVRSIEFVHQLQNLYYSLTGKELDIKPLLT